MTIISTPYPEGLQRDEMVVVMDLESQAIHPDPIEYVTPQIKPQPSQLLVKLLQRIE